MTVFYPRDTIAAPTPDGPLALKVTDRWNTPLGRPNGGWVLAAMLRTAMDRLDVGRPAVAAVTYFSAPEPGTTTTLTVAERKLGRRVQTADVSLACDDRPLAQLTASFIRGHAGLSRELGEPPDLPDPATLPDPRELGLPSDGLMGRVEYRLAEPPGWAVGRPSQNPVTELWQRLDGADVDWPALGLLCDAVPPPVLELGELTSMTVQLTVHFHRLPAPGSWIASRFSTRHVADGLHEEDGELWDQQGRLLAQSRQLAILL